jgi:hypothetical protein
MLENKKQDNIENVIIDYFKMVNQLSYKDISVRLNKEIGVCIIVVYTDSQRDMFPYVTPKNGRSPASIYISEMGEMFPYDFDINFDYKINTDERVYD